MLFNYKKIISTFRNDEHKKYWLEVYENNFGPVPSRLEDCKFYEFMSGFTPVPYYRGNYKRTSKDSDLFLQFVAASHNVEYCFDFSSPGITEPRLVIYAPALHYSLIEFEVQNVDEMEMSGIMKFFEYFLEEQFRRQILMESDFETREMMEEEKNSMQHRYSDWVNIIRIHEIGRKSRLYLKEIMDDLNRFTIKPGRDKG